MVLKLLEMLLVVYLHQFQRSTYRFWCKCFSWWTSWFKIGHVFLKLMVALLLLVKVTWLENVVQKCLFQMQVVVKFLILILEGGSTNIVVNVDASGSYVEGDEDQGRELGRLISVAVQSEIIQQKRPGGLLA